MTALAVSKVLELNTGVYYLLNDSRTNVKLTDANQWVCLNAACIAQGVARRYTVCEHVEAAQAYHDAQQAQGSTPIAQLAEPVIPEYGDGFKSLGPSNGYGLGALNPTPDLPSTPVTEITVRKDDAA